MTNSNNKSVSSCRFKPNVKLCARLKSASSEQPMVTPMTRETYNPDWKEFDREQQTIPKVEDREWTEIFKHRQFRTENEADAKTEILLALLAFLRLNSPYNNVNEYRQRLNAVAAIASKAADLAYELEKYTVQRTIMISPALDFDSGLRHTVVAAKRLQSFSKAGYSLRQPLKDALEALGNGDAGSKNGDVYWLVRILDRIVKTFSDEGGLTVTKTRPGHNNVGFVTKVMAIAQRESGRTIADGTIIHAIRKLKEQKLKSV